jgi:DNA topoisomerase-1
LRLIYDNHKEKRENIIQYKTTASFTNKQIIFTLQKSFETENHVLDFLQKSNDFKYELTVGAPLKSIKNPPKPFTTSRLLQTVTNLLHMSPKQIMEICQILYQNGYITYMRTESAHYSETFLQSAYQYIIKQFEKSEYIGDFTNIENKNNLNTHEAIRVTNLYTHYIKSTDDTNSNKIQEIYKIIWNNTIESCMASSQYMNHTLTITAPENNLYESSLEVPIFLGWKIVNTKNNNKNILGETENSLLFYLKSIKDKTNIPYNWIESTIQVSNRNTHYTEGSLIQKLESYGIGRPSTFAGIVDTIIQRGYVKRKDVEGTTIQCNEFRLNQQGTIEKTTQQRIFGNEKNKLVIDITGLKTLEFLLQYFEPLFSYDYTKKMET